MMDHEPTIIELSRELVKNIYFWINVIIILVLSTLYFIGVYTTFYWRMFVLAIIIMWFIVLYLLCTVIVMKMRKRSEMDDPIIE